jgi:hypothetical protein
MILRLEIHIDTTREDTFADMEEAIVALLEAALSMVTVQTVVTVPENELSESVYLEDER